MKLIFVLLLFTCYYSIVQSKQKCNLDAIFTIIYNGDDYDKITAPDKSLKYLTQIKNHKDLKIINGHVNVLCKDFVNHFKDTANLTLSALQLDDIELATFNDLKSLKSLEITDNNLIEIIGGVFNGLKIRSLSLERNGIIAIVPTAFDDMPNLKYLNLNWNKLDFVMSEWFNQKPMLSIVSLSYNSIDKLDENQFPIFGISKSCDVESTDLEKRCPIILLSHNRIKTIDNEAFGNNLKMDTIDLDHNYLTEVPTLWDNFNYKTVSLQYNDITYMYSDVVKTYLSAVKTTYLYANPLVYKNEKYLDKIYEENTNKIVYKTRKSKIPYYNVHEI